MKWLVVILALSFFTSLSLEGDDGFEVGKGGNKNLLNGLFGDKGKDKKNPSGGIFGYPSW